MNERDDWFQGVKRMRNIELRRLSISVAVFLACIVGVSVSIVAIMESDVVLEGYRALAILSGFVGGVTFLLMQNFLAEFSVVESEYQSLLKERKIALRIK